MNDEIIRGLIEYRTTNDEHPRINTWEAGFDECLEELIYLSKKYDKFKTQ
jgi:hypothetical protein